MTSERRRLLFLCQTLPFPPDGGVNIRSYNVLKILCDHFDVDALCFYRAADRPNPGDIERGIAGLAEVAKDVIAFPIPQEQSRVRLLADHGRSLLLGRPYVQYAYRSEAYRSRIRQLLAERTYDLIHVDSMDLVDYLDMFGDVPVACTHHNVESRLLERRAKNEEGWRRAYVAKQAKLVRKMEREWCPKVDLNVPVSQRDTEELQEIAPSADYVTVPNGVDVTAFQPAVGADEGLVFVGGSNWFPNRDALEHFARDIRPHLETPDSIPATWIGRCSEEERARYAAAGVTLTGYVDDIRPIVRDAACYIAPLRVGGGTRLKILDAWAMGKAIVCTSIGCEGLAAVDGQNILIRDDPVEFARAIERVLADADLRRSLGEEGRRTVTEIYAWPRIVAPLVESYERMIADRA